MAKPADIKAVEAPVKDEAYSDDDEEANDEKDQPDEDIEGELEADAVKVCYFVSAYQHLSALVSTCQQFHGAWL